MNFLEEETSVKAKIKQDIPKPVSSPSPSALSVFSTQKEPSVQKEAASTSASTSSSGFFDFNFDFKTILILFLFSFLLLVLVGINIFTILGNSVKNFMKALGYSTGTVINTSADTVSDVAKASIDIAEGSVQNIGNLLISSSGEPVPVEEAEKEKEKEKPKSLEETVQKNTVKPSEPNPDNSSNPIQNPISSDKSSWCLVGEYQNKRGCVPITESDKCLSGQIFPNQAMCLNPTLTP